MYVGSGYRQMSDSFNRILDTVIIEIEDDFRHRRRHPMLVPPNSAF
jgi:hypothetical protein